MFYKGRFGGILLALALTIPPALADITEGSWYEVGENNSVKLWRLDVPGETLPGFRGEILIEGPAEAVLAQVQDVDSHTEWMYRCAEARGVEKLDEHSTIAYNRTDSPWPAADRDVVVKTRVSRDEGGKVLQMTFRNVESDQVPREEGVVRMPRLEGAYTMTEVGPNRTRVTYQVEVDIGGRIPGWIASMVARDLPVKTLTSLRERVESQRLVSSK